MPRALTGAVALCGALAVAALPGALPGAATTRVISSRAAAGGAVEVFLTSANLSRRLTRMPDLPVSDVPPAGRVIAVDESVRDQTIKGFGGAMTDTSSWLIQDKLGAGARDRLMDALFGAGGIHLSFIRVPMGASDFTSGRRPYSYDDVRRGLADPGLARFSIRRDTRATLPLLEQALAINPGAFVIANPWSPPAWMKTNDSLANLGDRGSLKPAAGASLARYFVRFLEAYAGHGVHVNAITPQNEPGQESIYPGMHLSEPREAAFVREDLAPALRRAGLGTAIYGYDWGWARAQIRYAVALARSGAAGDLAGISTHCYIGNPAVISALHREAPGLDEIVDECSPGIMPVATSEAAIASSRNWASAFDLWNLALDPSGGPVQPPNDACRHCTAVVTIGEATHRVTFTRDYYQLGQFSKFVLPGAVRIASTSFVRYEYPGPGGGIATRGLDDVAFENPDGSKVLVAYNNSAARRAFVVRDDGGYFSYALPGRATATFIWNQPQPPTVAVPPARARGSATRRRPG